MRQIQELFLLLTREFLPGTAEDSKRRILLMRTEGQTYQSQLAPAARIITRVVGDFPVSDPTHVMAVLSITAIVPAGLSRTELEAFWDNTTFGWFDIDNGVTGAIAANFGHPIAVAGEPFGAKPQVEQATPPWERIRCVEYSGNDVEEAARRFEDIGKQLTDTEIGTLSMETLRESEVKTARWAVANLNAIQPRVTLEAEGSEILSTEVVEEGKTEVVIVEAHSESKARYAAIKRVSTRVDHSLVDCLKAPEKHLFGLRRQRGNFRITLVRYLIVNVSYRIPARVRFTWISDVTVPAPKRTPGQRQVQVSTAGRNDPCPCGSGMKYKSCHGKLA